MNGNALGLIETLGLVGLIGASTRCSRRRTSSWRARSSSWTAGVVSAMVRGDVAACARRSRRGPRRRPRSANCTPAHVIPGPACAAWSGICAGGAAREDSRRQSGHHELQVSALRPRGTGRAGAGAGAVERIGGPRTPGLVNPARASRDRIGRSPTTATRSRCASNSSRSRDRRARPTEVGRDRLQGRPRARRHRASIASTNTCSPRWRRTTTSPPPTTRRTSRRCGCSGDGSRSCRWWPPSRPAFTGRSPRPTALRDPDDWATELGIRRWGFHGASHRYIAGRWPRCWAGPT